MKLDPHQHEAMYKGWRNRGSQIKGVNQPSCDLIIHFLEDMEIGANVSPVSKKGPRGYGRLRNLKSKMHTLTIIFQEEIGLQSLANLVSKEKELLVLINRMRRGEICSERYYHQPLKAVGNYVQILKTFWHWYQRIKKKEGIEIPDITSDLDCKDAKPKFNYFTIDQVKKMCDVAAYDYRVLMMFLFDSGIRAPTELMNVRVSDLEWDSKGNYYILTIREETSKTFGRKIRLLLCSEILKGYLNKLQLKDHEYIFTKNPQRVNQYLKKLGFEIMGLGTPAVKVYNNKKTQTITNGISVYDFRHSSACYWLLRYKSESALKYRFGWKKSDMIFYYTELLGMKDTIQEEDLYIDTSKPLLEKQLQTKCNEIDLLQEQLKSQDKHLREIMDIVKALQLERVIESKKSL